jgi:anti-sigma factor RsiW
MQHLDEGTIHSWLDGALSADEAARVEAHVKECPQCAAAMAEARGFIAASSRILTALDNAPRGVVPVAAPKKRVDPIVWRVAATLLVVAGGTLVVFRSGGREAPIATTNADTSQNAITGVSPTAPAGGETKMTAEPTPPVRKPANSTRGTTIGSLQPSAVLIEKSAAKVGAAGTSPPTLQALPAPTPGVSYSGVARASASQTNIPARENQKVAAPVSGAATGNISLSSGSAGAAAPTPQTLSALRLRGATAVDKTGAQFPLKEVGHPRTLGVKVTLYEVAPGDTVTFTEPVSLQLNAVVVTGVGTEERVARQTAGKAAAAPAKRADAAGAPDSARPTPTVGAIAPAPSAPVPATRVKVTNGVTTISWPDPTTGSVLTLSGRMPEARLQQIRIRIDRERAAAAAKKKP